MAARVKVWLAWVALAELFLALINILLFVVTRTAPVSLFVSIPLGVLAGGYLVHGFLVPTLLGQPDSERGRALTGQ